MKIALPLIAIVTLVSACAKKDGQISLENNAQVNSAPMVMTHDITPGSACSTGGLEVVAGIDANQDKKLEDNEVSHSKLLCSGPAGTNSLVRVFDEPQGENCVSGGKKIITGLDADMDNQLATSKVADTQYWCAPEPQTTAAVGPVSLVRVYDEAAGNNCVNGGKRIATGDDLNNNQQLDAEEVNDVQYICNGANGANGVDSPTNRITETLACSGPLQDWPDYLWRFKLNKFTNGDAVVSASILSAATTVDAVAFFPAQELTKKLPGAQFVYDVKGAANWGSWTMYVDESKAMTYVIYDDQDLLGTLPDVTVSTIGWSLSTDKCKKTTY